MKFGQQSSNCTRVRRNPRPCFDCSLARIRVGINYICTSHVHWSTPSVSHRKGTQTYVYLVRGKEKPVALMSALGNVKRQWRPLWVHKRLHLEWTKQLFTSLSNSHRAPLWPAHAAETKRRKHNHASLVCSQFRHHQTSTAPKCRRPLINNTNIKRNSGIIKAVQLDHLRQPIAICLWTMLIVNNRLSKEVRLRDGDTHLVTAHTYIATQCSHRLVMARFTASSRRCRVPPIIVYLILRVNITGLMVREIPPKVCNLLASMMAHMLHGLLL